MDVSNSDADFDSYWEDEARNPNRNRIRIGRQYQATVPPLLKPGESDGRTLEELETLRWKPDNELTDEQLDQYLSVAKAISLFARAIDNNYTQSTDSQIETNTNSIANTETTANSNENANCSSDKTKTNTENSSSSTSSVKDHQIQSALKGLSDFVSSHHPGHHDIGCRIPITPEQITNSAENEHINSLTSLLSGEWTANETKLFSRALEVCGKNFGAIKKDFLPWKSVKSIIEYYYLGIDRESSQRSMKNEKENVTSGENVVNTNSNSSAFEVLSSVSKFMTSHLETEFIDAQKAQSSKKSSEDFINSEVKKNFEDIKTTSSISGLEVKPLKAKPILPSAIQESNSNVSTIGSLKFYLDGQLVLKLNAQQELTGQKCQWVESLDTAKRPRPVHKTNKRLLIERQDIELHNHSNNHKSDEMDDLSGDSSDDDSMESNESALVSSPSAFIAKKAKVKIENSCHIPLPSPTSLSIKDQRNDGSNQCNRNIKLENSVMKREHMSSPTNSLVNMCDDEQRRKSMVFSPFDQTINRKNNSLENKWYHTIVEKSSVQPPKAHSTSSLIGQMHRHLRYDAMQTSLGSSSSSSSTCSSSSSSSSNSSLSVPVTTAMTAMTPITAMAASLPSNAIPVDLTRKSTNCSPLETKSSPSTSSTPNNSAYYEKDKNSKVLESPSPPRLQPPFVFPYPAYLPLSPTQCHNKIKKDVKSSNNSCQKVEARILKSSPPDSPSSIPSTPPPQPLPPSQLAWLQNSLVSYLPIYEQYYRYYYGYGMPSTNHPSGGVRSSNPTHDRHRETEPNRERAKCLTDALLIDGDEGNCGP